MKKQSIKIDIFGRGLTPKDVHERLAPLLSQMSVKAMNGEMVYYQGEAKDVGTLESTTLNVVISFVNVEVCDE